MPQSPCKLLGVRKRHLRVRAGCEPLMHPFCPTLETVLQKVSGRLALVPISNSAFVKAGATNTCFLGLPFVAASARILGFCHRSPLSRDEKATNGIRKKNRILFVVACFVRQLKTQFRFSVGCRHTRWSFFSKRIFWQFSNQNSSTATKIQQLTQSKMWCTDNWRSKEKPGTGREENLRGSTCGKQLKCVSPRWLKDEGPTQRRPG